MMGLCSNRCQERLHFQWRNLDFDGSGDGGNDSGARGFGGVFQIFYDSRCTKIGIVGRLLSNVFCDVFGA